MRGPVWKNQIWLAFSPHEGLRETPGMPNHRHPGPFEHHCVFVSQGKAEERGFLTHTTQSRVYEGSPLPPPLDIMMRTTLSHVETDPHRLPASAGTKGKPGNGALRARICGNWKSLFASSLTLAPLLFRHTQKDSFGLPAAEEKGRVGGHLIFFAESADYVSQHVAAERSGEGNGEEGGGGGCKKGFSRRHASL